MPLRNYTLTHSLLLHYITLQNCSVTLVKLCKFCCVFRVVTSSGHKCQQWSNSSWCWFRNLQRQYLRSTPPWLLARPAVKFTLHCSDKSNTSPEVFKHRFYELSHEFKNYYRIFTDGSKEGNRVAAAVVHRDNTKRVRLSDTAPSELNYMSIEERGFLGRK